MESISYLSSINVLSVIAVLWTITRRGCLLGLVQLAIAASASEVNVFPHDSSAQAICYILLKKDIHTSDSEILLLLKGMPQASPLDRVTDALIKKKISIKCFDALTLENITDAKSKDALFVIELLGISDIRLVNTLLIVEPATDGLSIIDGVPPKRRKISIPQFIDLCSKAHASRAIEITSNDWRSEQKKESNDLPVNILSKATLQYPDNSKEKAHLIYIGEKVWVAKVIDIGKVRSGVQKTLVHMPIRNENNSAIRVINIKGACSCFQGIDGDNSIGPKTASDVSLNFDFTKYSPGEVFDTQIAYEIANTNLSPQIVHVTGVIDDSDLLFSEPSIVDFGLVSANVDSLNKDLSLRILNPKSFSGLEKVSLKTQDTFLSGVKNTKTKLNSIQGVIELARYTININPKQCGVGLHEGVIKCELNQSHSAMIEIPWRIRVFRSSGEK